MGKVYQKFGNKELFIEKVLSKHDVQTNKVSDSGGVAKPCNDKKSGVQHSERVDIQRKQS